MPMERWPMRLMCGVMLLVISLPAVAAPAPDDAALQRQIEGLRRDGMAELLIRLAETEGERLEPADRLNLLAEAHEMRYQARDVEQEERMKSLSEALAAYKKLLDDYRADHRRVIWQTNYATLVLFGELGIRRQEAALFYDLGLPSREQIDAFESYVATLFGHMAEGEILLFELEGTLPRRADFQQRFVDTGLWQRLREEYGQVRLPLLQGILAYYTSLLPDDHPYFQNLGRNQQVARQARTIEQERTRLQTLAMARLRRFADDERDVYRLRAFAQPVYARLLLRMDRLPEARAQAQAMVELNRNDINDLSARIVLATIRGREGQVAEAVKAFEALTQHELVKQNILYRLLATDAEHRWRVALAEAETNQSRKRELMGVAYRIYDRVMDDTNIPAEQRQALRSFIYDRWARTVARDTSPDMLPLPVLLAVGQYELQEGRADKVRAMETEPDERETAIEAANARMERSIQMHEAALAIDDITTTDRAQAIFNLGLARLELAERRNRQAVLAAVNEWKRILTDEQMRQADIAVNTATYSLGLLRDLYYLDINNVPDDLAEAYISVSNLLFAHFPDLRITHDERKLFGFYVHQLRGEYERAVAVYEPLPATHPDYWWVQREKIYCLLRIHETLEEAEAGQIRLNEARERLIRAARAIRQGAEAALPRATGTRAAEIRQASAEAMLSLAEIYSSERLWAQAREALEGWENMVGDDRELRRRALEQVIVVYVQTDALSPAQEAARALLAEAAAQEGGSVAVVDDLLAQLTRRMEEADERERVYAQRIIEGRAGREEGVLREEYANQRSRYARATEIFARLLIEHEQARDADDERIFPLQLTEARALRFRDELTASVEKFEELHESHPESLDVVIELAESHWAIARQIPREDRERASERATHMDRAFALFDRLVLGGRAEASRDPHGILPWYYWLGQLRRLEIILSRQSTARDQLERMLRDRRIEAVTQKLNQALAAVEEGLREPGISEDRADLLRTRRQEVLDLLAAPINERLASDAARLESDDMGGFRRQFERIENAVQRMTQ
ncbi:MAG: hypothetical protein JJU36_10460 [Phycisphaeraceae bacterium]|nr:hypothetical protein [Phycisphaeraceae bacterium]